MENNKLQTILKEQDVTPENAQELITAFGAPFEEAGEILADYKTIAVTDESQVDQMKLARTKRLALRGVRIDVEHKRKQLKENSLKTGRAIDSVARFVKDIIEPAEDYLQLQEDFVKNKRAKETAELKAERTKELSRYGVDVSLYDLDHMTNDQFADLLKSTMDAYEARQAEAKRAEAERVAQRKKDEEEREAQRLENERLKAEAVKRDKALADAKRKADAKLAAERAKTEQLRREKAEREAAEAAERAAAEEAKRQALLAPDKEKLLAVADRLESMELPALSSEDAQAVLNKTKELLDKVSKYIRGNVKGL